MPDPVKAPPEERVEELKNEIIAEIALKYNVGSDMTLTHLFDRCSLINADLITQLAVSKAVIEMYENK